MRRFLRHIGLWATAAFFSWSTVLLAAGPLRALRLTAPFWIFWPCIMLMTSGLWLVGLQGTALSFAAVALVIGIFTELEGWGASRGPAAIGASATLVATVGLAFGYWCRQTKQVPIAVLTKWAEPVFARVREFNPNFVFDTDSVLAQIPSGVIALGLIALALAAVTQATWVRFAGVRSALVNRSWTDFQLWDVTVYLLMAALLAVFVRHENKTVLLVGLNVLNVLFVLYFFQGMAVIFRAFSHYRVGAAWRMFFGFVLVFQLAILVAVVGLADYWLEFRNRLKRKPADAQTS